MKNIQAFTLIELLVVVLIIGILAAVALPQYQKAVEKSKSAQAITMLKSVYNAAKAYQLANGEWPTSFDELAVDIPWTGTTNAVAAGGNFSRGKSNADWSIQIYNSTMANNPGTTIGLLIGRISGPYAGTAFQIYAVSPYPSTVPTDTPLCLEMRSGSNIYTFTDTRGNYCTKAMKGTLIPTSDSWDHFRLP